MLHAVRRRALAVVATVVGAVLLSAAPALAHGFSSTVYADVTSPEAGHVRTELGLEYDLLVVSAADAAQDDDLFRDGTRAFEDGDAAEQAAALEDHLEPVLAYVTERFGVTAEGEACPRSRTATSRSSSARASPT